MTESKRLIGESRKVREESRGELTVNIPREIAERRGLDGSDTIHFVDDPDEDEPKVMFPSSE